MDLTEEFKMRFPVWSMSFFAPSRTDKVRGPSSLLCNEYWFFEETNWPGHEADHRL